MLREVAAGIGAWLGPTDTLWLSRVFALAGGALGVIVAWHEVYCGPRFEIVPLLTYWRSVGLRPVPNFTLDSAKTPRLAYAIPIFAGTVMTLWL